MPEAWADRWGADVRSAKRKREQHVQSNLNRGAFMNSKMKAAQIGKPGGDWELIERDIPDPGAGQVRVKVEACGICQIGRASCRERV